MKIQQITAYPYRIPLHSLFTTAHGILSTRTGAIVEIQTDSGISGLGEIAPLPEFHGETLSAALSALPDLSTQLTNRQLTDALHILHQSPNHQPATPPTTLYALECALLDALGQAEQLTLSQLLGPNPRSHVTVNAVIGASTIPDAVQSARNAIAAGFTCLKLKLSAATAEAIERVAAVRAAVGPDIHLRLDANEAWNFAQARTILTACTPFTIQYVEQPLKADDLAGMHKLRELVTLPIAADEAISSLASARRVLAADAADILIVKPQLTGGLSVAQQIIQEASAQGIQCTITSTIETGIGLTAALHLAAAIPQITLECGLATLALLEDDLLQTDLPIHHGTLAVPTAPGLGIQLDRQALAKYTTYPEAYSEHS